MPKDIKPGKIPDIVAFSNNLPGRPFQKRKQLERDIEHITAEMYKRNRELATTNKTLSLLRTIDGLALESHASLKVVSEHVAEAITRVTNYSLVCLMTRSPHTKTELILSGSSTGAWLGRRPNQTLGFSRPVYVKLDHPWFLKSTNTDLIDLDSLSTASLARFLNCTQAELRRAKKQLPIKSAYVVKLLARRQIVGLLLVGFTTPISQIGEADMLLIDRLSESIGVALDNKLLFEENQRVLKQLKESNTKLLELDETKDDFISMASHQLRTPLTSVKGYISMILDGDAGKLTIMQREMLGQAFFSSQRMVYLIADLLNVSRLRTGKFVVELSPVNLAEVVSQELEQLRETAEARKLKLSYNKPKRFPEMMLDETKTRQVVMNFIDNAIYYTAAGGHITVSLETKPKTVELRVKDNGIGVPSDEQPHLFTKFYRAANARQARPDGTGLGLFMAKKVIIAQGGSLVFESQENKGSTFGFVLNRPRRKL